MKDRRNEHEREKAREGEREREREREEVGNCENEFLNEIRPLKIFVTFLLLSKLFSPFFSLSASGRGWT